MPAPRAESLTPTISVGIPTYNRDDTLGRAIESVLSQTHAELELIVSDNASSDRTQEICQRYASADERVRYIRQPLNRGPTANFNTLFRECRGEYALMLSDDDWLDPDYVERCLVELGRSGDRALVCGLTRYFSPSGARVADGVEMQLTQAGGEERALAYLRRVRDNGTFYGVMPREVLARAAPLLNVLGNDWLLVAAIAYQGEVRTLRTTAINRVTGGTSKDVASIAEIFGKPSFQARLPHLVIAWHTVAELGWRAQVYRDLGVGRRLLFALRGGLCVINWRSLAWHATMPTAASLQRRTRGKAVARGYFYMSRRLGAGRQRYL